MARLTPNREVLNRQLVVQTAAELVNSEGVEALTINRLAKELGVRPPSLYNHIRSLAGLRHDLALLSMQNLGERLINAAAGRSGAPGIMILAEKYRASLRASGKTEPADPLLEAAEARIVRVSLAMVESFGLSGKEAIHAVRALRSAIHGFTTLEIADGFGIRLDLDESFARLIEMIIRGIEQLAEKSPMGQ